MTCQECGRWMPSDPTTGYDADAYCSLRCEEAADRRRAEDEEGEGVDPEPTTCPACGEAGCTSAPYCGLFRGDLA
jgi:hypothetical protein